MNLRPGIEHAVLMVWAGACLALAMATGVILERLFAAFTLFRRQHTGRRYAATVERALDGDQAAIRALAESSWRRRAAVALMLITPLVDDRNPDLIARTRALARAINLGDVADRALRSRWWRRRALALRAVGLLQFTDRTPAVVKALDDLNEQVRATALDALADLHDPACLQGLVVRLHDESLQGSRVAAAIAAFGTDCEPFLLELAEVDVINRLNYARALSICGTEHARPILIQWTADPRPEVRAAAFEALGRVGLDTSAAALAVDALGSRDEGVRAMAAYALRGWTGPVDAVSHLVGHLEDRWPVAVRAAQALQSMHQPGILALQQAASRPDLAGLLARQALWEMQARS